MRPASLLAPSLAPLSLAGLLLFGVGCSNEAESSNRLTVVTSVSPITDVVRQIGGSEIELVGLIPEGTDSHTYELPPSAAKTLVRADVVILNGLNLETKVEKLASSVAETTEIVRLADRTTAKNERIFDTSFPVEHGDPNPHAWMDPGITSRYATLIEAELSMRAPEFRALFTRRLQRFSQVLNSLDAAISEASTTIPEAQRKLLTYHDSFPYFARRYGFTVIGAIQPADFSEPSPREITRLIAQLSEERVPAIFGSEVFPSPVVGQIRREAGVDVVSNLRDDDLPGDSGPAHSYVGMMLENARTIVTALGGDPTPLDRVPPSETLR